jgi:hypothetical protein
MEDELTTPAMSIVDFILVFRCDSRGRNAKEIVGLKVLVPIGNHCAA